MKSVMDRRDRTCPLCARMIAADDTIVFGRYHLSHLDCRQPKALSPEERALLFFYCREHPIAECPQCTRSFGLFELASNPRDGQTHLCPLCRENLSARIRAHLDDCAMLPVEVRRGAHEVREAARNLVKGSQQLRDAAGVLAVEAEAALENLRQAMRESPIRPR